MKLDIKNLKQIAAGGEGVVYEHPTNSKQVVKIYHQPRNINYIKHLESLKNLPNEFIKPIDIFSDNNQLQGFSMNYINFSDYYLFNNLYNKGFCSTNQISFSFKENLLIKLKKLIEEIHLNNVIIGDLNPYNIFFSLKEELLLIDVDSYGTKDQKHSGVLLDEIKDWTSQDVTKNTDSWAFAILCFWSLSYIHPFKWVSKTNKDDLATRVRKGLSILNNIPNIKIPPIYNKLSDDYESEFKSIFNGRRFLINLKNTGSNLINVVVKPQVSSNNLTITLIQDKVFQIYNTLNKLSINYNSTKQWRFYDTTSKGMCIIQKEFIADALYPGNNKYLKLVENKLYDDKKVYSFYDPRFYFYNGQLQVIDYGEDLLSTYTIDNQLGGVQKNETIVYSRSIIKRDSLIQNFGNKKYLITPLGNSYTLTEVNNHTKNAYIQGEFVLSEIKDQYKLYFELKNTRTKQTYQLDYFAFFTSKANLIFIPEDGRIDVKGNQFEHIISFDCPNCTRSSKLYTTNAGILLLENQSLYLLNVK